MRILWIIEDGSVPLDSIRFIAERDKVIVVRDKFVPPIEEIRYPDAVDVIEKGENSWEFVFEYIKSYAIYDLGYNYDMAIFVGEDGMVALEHGFTWIHPAHLRI